MRAVQVPLYFFVFALALLASQVPHSTPKQYESLIDLFIEFLDQIDSEKVWMTESKGTSCIEHESKWKSIVDKRLALQVKIDDYCLTADRLGAKMAPRDVLVLKYFAKLFRAGFAPKFVSDFNNFIGAKKPKNKLNMDAKVLNDFPSILKPLTDTFGQVIAGMVEREFIGRVYQSPVADLNIPDLDRKFRDMFIDKDRSQTLHVLCQGCLQKSKKALEMWHALYHHVVYGLGEGVSGFERIIGEKERPFFENLISIYKARKPVNVILDDDLVDVASFVSKTSFKTVQKEQVRSDPYGFFYSADLNNYIQILLAKGHLTYHPNNGKILLTSSLGKKHRSHVVKLFKVMICLNMAIPRLALTEAEYETANKLHGQPKFVYNRDLIEELNKVTDNIASHFQYFRINYATNADYQLRVILNPILCDPEFTESLAFMLVGKSMDGQSLSLSNFEYTDEKVLVTVGAPYYRITIHPNLTREEYVALFEMAELDREAPVRTFRSRLSESNDGKQVEKTEPSSQEDTSSNVDGKPTSTKDKFEQCNSTVVDYSSDTSKSTDSSNVKEPQSSLILDCGRDLRNIQQTPSESRPAWNFLKSFNQSHKKIISTEPLSYYPDYETFCELIKADVVDLLANDQQ